jgi:DNA-binding MarR family transcriptional regulator
MGISQDIQQKSFKSEYSKAIINVFYTSAWLDQKHADLFKTNSITAPQYNVLRILRGQHPKPATVNLIIERMLDKSSNASRIIDRLELKGLVIRRQCPSDRRAVDVMISEAGLALLKKMDVEFDVFEKKLCNLSEKEAAQLNELLDKMRL